MRHQRDFQYKAGKSGRSTIKVILTIQTSSEFETRQVLNAAGYSSMRTDLDFKQCISKGDKPLDPTIPLITQVN
jgi:hypothetical protein